LRRFELIFVKADDAVSIRQVPTDGCFGRCHDHYESGKQKVSFTKFLC